MKKLWLLIPLMLLVGFVVVDVCIAVDGFVAYRSNTGTDINSPKIRYWNNTANSGNGSWGSEIELASTGSPIRYLMMKQSPINSKIVLVTLSDNGNLSGYVCMKNCTNSTYWNLTTQIGMVWLAAAPATQRRFDISFESSSGDLLLVYGVYNTGAANDLAYRVLLDNATSFSGTTEQLVNDGGHAADMQYIWIVMDSDPVNTSNELLIGGFDDTNNDFNTWIWNGTALGAINSITDAATATTNREAHAVKYSSDGSKGMAISGDGTNGNYSSEYWNGTAWTVLGLVDIDSADANDIQWISMKADPNSDDLQAVVQDSGSDLHTIYWNGSTWFNVSNIDTGVDVATARTADFSWLNDGTGRLVWDTDGALTTLSQRVCNPRCNNTASTFSTYAGTGAWVTLFRNPTVTEIVKFLGIRLNSAFDIGSFRYNGTTLNYTNYGDNVITADTTVTTYEAFAFDFRRDVRPPGINMITPNESGLVWNNGTFRVNLTTNEYVPYVTMEVNGTNYSVDGLDMIWYNATSWGEGFYTYKIFTEDWAGNKNDTGELNLTIDYPPNITIIDPQNNTLNTTSRNITFIYNVTDSYGNVSSCSLIIDNAWVINVTGPINETANQNFTYLLTNGQHNWSVWCNDSNNVNSTSEIRNITIRITPVISSITLDDGLMPFGEILLNAGSTRFVNCSVTATDPEGVTNLVNASGTFYYYLNKSTDPDNNNVHYSNTSCQVTASTSTNKTFTCGFYPLYYANNGTWNCNVTVVNNYSINTSSNVSNLIQPLYAVNLTDGIEFSGVAAGFPSSNITANITNFGNMAVNVTIQGYAIFAGDNVGMNCSDGTNITISRIKFSTNSTATYAQKTSLNGSIQLLNLRVLKQVNTTQVFNTTYWQIDPDPGIANRICGGYIIFSAEAS